MRSFHGKLHCAVLAVALCAAPAAEAQNFCGPGERFAGNPVLAADGSGCDWVDSPAVLHDESEYKMWFACGRNSIHLATSPDGIAWADQGQVLTGTEEWNFFDVFAPTVVKVGAGYHMWFNGSDGFSAHIGHAISPDGRMWQVEPRDVFFRAFEPEVLYQDGVFTIWFGEQAAGPGEPTRIMRSISANGADWSEPVPVLTPDQPWESALGGPAVIARGGVFQMWYHAFGPGAAFASVGHAQSSDGMVWTKCATNPVLVPGSAGWENGPWVLGPDAVEAGQDVRVYYTGTRAVSNNGTGIGFITLAGNRPPECGGAMPIVGPADKDLAPVTIAGVTDPDGDPVTITLTRVTQDEPVNEQGDGNTCPDAVMDAAGGVVQVRIERQGGGNSRIYAIGFVATDGRGGSCEGTVTVCVPHDNGSGPMCVDDGQAFDSFAECPDRDLVELQPASGLSLGVTRVAELSVGLEYSLPRESDVHLAVYDVAGRRVAVLVHARQGAGPHRVSWNAAGLSRGVYFCRLQAAGASVTRTVPVPR